MQQKNMYNNAASYYCKICDFTTHNKTNYEKHLGTLKHLTLSLGTISTRKSIQKYYNKKTREYHCSYCDLTTKHPNNFAKHLSTLKHKRILYKKTNEIKETSLHICSICNKEYKHRCSLYKHMCQKHPESSPTTKCRAKYDSDENLCSTYINKKHIKKCTKKMPKCKNISENLEKKSSKTSLHMKAKLTADCENEIVEENNIIMSKKEYELSLECSKLRGKIEALESKQTVVNNNFQYNPVNIHMYLDEKYKDAMNLNDFVERLELTNEDLSVTKDEGYVKGVSHILLKNLNKIGEEERPIHYIKDANTKEIYVRDENKWGKESGKLDKGITRIEKLQLKACSLLNIDNDDEFLRLIKYLTNIKDKHRRDIKNLLKRHLEIQLK